MPEEQKKIIKKTIKEVRYDSAEKDNIIKIIGESLSESKSERTDIEDCIEILEFIRDESGWI